MHNGIAEPPPERQILKARDPGRKKRILDTKRANPNMKASEIARIEGCQPGYVRRVLNDLLVKPVKANLRKPAPPGPSVTEAGHAAQAEPGAASNLKWFQRAVADPAALISLIAGLDPLLERLRRGEKFPKLSTNLADPSRVRNITALELKANTFRYDLNSTDKKERGRSKNWVRDHFSGTKRSSQGFTIMDAHKEQDGSHSEALFKHLTPLLDENKHYRKELKTIFQTLQSNKNPKGDGKRLQAKMTALVALSKKRLKEAEDLVAFRKQRGPPGKKAKKEKRTLPMLQEELMTVQKEVAVIQESTMAMTRAYDRLQKVPALPYCRAGSPLITCVAGVAQTPPYAEIRFRHRQARRASIEVRCWRPELPPRFARARQLRRYSVR